MRWSKREIARLVNDLEAKYGRQDRPRGYDPMEELISCILTQNSTDAVAFPTFDRLWAKYKTWDRVARLSPGKLADEIRAAGLANQKAAAIIGSLREIHARLGEYTLEPLREMPLDEAREWLTSLPGVGPKTAAIVLCFAFGLPAIPVDTHVFRVSWRLGLIEKKLGAARAHDALEKLVPGELAFRFHTAVIRHGRETCKAPTPRCEACVVRDRCRWFKEVVRASSPST